MAIPSALARSLPPEYRRHRPEASLLYPLIREYWPEFQAELASQGRYLPAYVTKVFAEYLKCGRLEHDFLRVRCESCHDEKLVAFSCKRRGFCPSCGASRMADSAALLVDEVLPHLHMHAERGGEEGEILNGEAVAMLIDGRFLLRGDTFGD